MSEKGTKTLWDLLTNNLEVLESSIRNGIEIPMIQRDYAQGRTDKKSNSIRNKFLNDIHNKLFEFQKTSLSKPLELDFIYGYISDDKFIPLDGQQRLTTLYLIHWFVCFKDGVLGNYVDQFNKFTYKTRVSSKDFFEELNKVENVTKLEIIYKKGIENNNLIDVIKDQSWFQVAWTNDPTIQSVLVVIEEIQSLFDDINFNTILKNREVVFYLLNINVYGLSDSLYIKMNARGKPLTDFENLKASIEGILKETSQDLGLQFSKLVDNEWLDKF